MPKLYDHKNLLLLLFYLLLSAIFASCLSKSNDEKIQKSLIRDIIMEIETAFNRKDLDGIMKHYHVDYLHFGKDFQNQKWEWQSRINDYARIEFDLRNIILSNDYAIVEMIIYYYDRDSITPSFYTYEPQTSGDLSYFFYNFREWVIFGNQRWEKKHND